MSQIPHARYESVFRFRVMVFDGVITFRGVIGAEGCNFCILMGAPSALLASMVKGFLSQMICGDDVFNAMINAMINGSSYF